MNKKIYNVLLRIISGLLDTVLPNVQKSIDNKKQYNPKTNKQELSIDWIRLISSFIVFILLLLNLIGFIDAKEFVKHVFNELQSNIP
jgi:hypothetical protein